MRIGMMVDWHEFRELTDGDEKHHEGISRPRMTLRGREFSAAAFICAHSHSSSGCAIGFCPVDAPASA